jgi:hypothetical protein
MNLNQFETVCVCSIISECILKLFFIIKGLYVSELRLSREIGNEISKSRIEALTDGVYAIVMTLLVLEIAVPQLTHSEVAAGELSKKLFEFVKKLYSHLLQYFPPAM